MASDEAARASSERRHGWDPSPSVALRPVALTVALYAALALALGWTAYWQMFTQFATYDDEGSLLVTLAGFVDGGTLYRGIYSQYGPFYYEVFGGLFALTGQSVTTDASRFIVVVIWVAISVLCGLIVHRLSGRLSLGAVGTIVAFAVLFILKQEPMHPHGLSLLVLSGFVLIVVAGPTRRVGLTGGACGALLAALTLTKINLGVFAIAAVALAAVLTSEPLHRRTYLRWPVVGAFGLMPIALMRTDLGTGWVVDLVLVEGFAAVAVVIAAWPARARPGEEGIDLWRWLLAAAAGFVIASVAILAAILLTGPTLGEVYSGMVGEAVRLRDAFVAPYILGSEQVYFPIAGAVAAALAVRSRRDHGIAGIWPGVLRVCAGVLIWLAVAQLAPFADELPPDRLAVVLALAWVSCLGPTGLTEGPYRRFSRVLIPALAVAGTLQVYPVAGSQVTIAMLLFVPVGGLCVADGLWSLRQWSRHHWSDGSRRFGVVAGIVIVALGAGLAFERVVRPASEGRDLYAFQPPLSLPGAARLHLPPDQVSAYSRLVGLLRDHRCTAFAGYPSVNSLYLWSEIPPTETQLPGAWMTLLDGDQQRRAVKELRASPRPCAIRNDPLGDGWLLGGPRPDTPLVRYIFDGFRPTERIGEFIFLLPRERGA